jgi:hypothetical protein
MTGDLILSINAAPTRTLGCNYLTGSNQFRLLLGSPLDAIVHQPTFPVFIHGSNGIQMVSNVGNALFGQSSTDARIGFYEDLIMNNNKITNLTNPASAQDAATKNYVDGYIDSVFKVVYVPSTGSDTNGAGSITNPYATLDAAIAGIDGSGWKVAVMPGTYTENITTGLQNLTIELYLFEMGAIINIAGTLKLTHTASSIPLIGITATNIAHTGAGSLYMMRCRTNTNFATSGGYVEMTDCDTQGGAGTGTLTISGTASRVIRGGYVGIITHTNATTSSNEQSNCAPITHISGTLALGIGSVYAATGTSNALSSAAGTVIIDGTTFLTPTNTNARINIAAGVVYQIVSAKYDKANSTIDGPATVLNAIYYNISDPTISTEPTTKNYVGSNGALMVKKDGSIAMTGNLNLNTHSITSVVDPVNAQDAATKNYVDEICNVTSTPYMTGDTTVVNGLTFISSASTINNALYPAYKAFKNSTDANGWVCTVADAVPWIQMKYPNPIICNTVNVTVRNVTGRNILTWNVQGSKDGTTFTTLFNSSVQLTAGNSYSFRFIIIIPYVYSRFNILTRAGGNDVGISMLQFIRPQVLSDGTVVMTCNQNMGANKITSVVDPSAAQDVATKNYVDLYFSIERVQCWHTRDTVEY